MNKAMLSVIAVLLGLSSLLGYFVYSGGQEIAELKQTNNTLIGASERAAERLKSDREVLVAREATIAAQRRKLAAAKTTLQKSLQSNNSWSNTNVPPDVLEALQEAIPALPGPSGNPALSVPAGADGVCGPSKDSC